jgi:hypothetical protein
MAEKHTTKRQHAIATMPPNVGTGCYGVTLAGIVSRRKTEY